MSESATEYRYPQEQDQEQPNTEPAEGLASAEADMGQVKETYEDTRFVVRHRGGGGRSCPSAPTVSSYAMS